MLATAKSQIEYQLGHHSVVGSSNLWRGMPKLGDQMHKSTKAEASCVGRTEKTSQTECSRELKETYHLLSEALLGNDSVIARHRSNLTWRSTAFTTQAT